MCATFDQNTLQRFDLYRVHKVIPLPVHGDLDLLPLTSAFNKTHLKVGNYVSL